MYAKVGEKEDDVHYLKVTSHYLKVIYLFIYFCNMRAWLHIFSSRENLWIFMVSKVLEVHKKTIEKDISGWGNCNK